MYYENHIGLECNHAFSSFNYFLILLISYYPFSSKIWHLTNYISVPDAPTGVSCANVYDVYIRLTWVAPQFPNGDISHYEITVLTTTYAMLFKRNTTSNSTTFDVDGLEPGNLLTYCWVFIDFCVTNHNFVYMKLQRLLF